MAETLSERERSFNEGLQAAIDHLKGCATAIGKIDGNTWAQCTAPLITVAADQSDLRALRKRSGAAMQVVLDAETKQSV
jgi:hypothetical protein